MRRTKRFLSGALLGTVVTVGSLFVASPAAACEIVYFGCVSCLVCDGEATSCHINEANPACEPI